MARKKIVAGNWKMFKVYDEAIALVENLLDELDMERIGSTHVILAPPFVHLQTVTEMLMFTEGIAVAAQNCHDSVQGAFTGEVSAAMIKSIDADAVILGHSERRQYFGETDVLIAKKIDAALKAELVCIYCCGETLSERKASQHLKVVENQIKEALASIKPSDMANVVVAYEPVWAIGTGETASVEQAGEMHKHIRAVLSQMFGEDISTKVSILYGGSVKPDNAGSLFAHPEIDGGLVGGASLNAKDFIDIIYAMPQ